jgi:hypothetical protein
MILTGLLTYDANATSVVHTLGLPLLMAVGTALALQNMLAVALAITALAAVHAEPQAPDWVISRAYPFLAAVGAATIVVILVRRFRSTVQATREAREAARRARKTS